MTIPAIPVSGSIGITGVNPSSIPAIPVSGSIGIDFETYSEAGYTWAGDRWRSVSSSPPHGIGAVGANAYAAHASTEILSLAYGSNLWLPGMPPPVDLFEFIKSGRFCSAWNCAFEFWIWHHVGRRLGWPPLPWFQLVDNMPRARLSGYPGKLSAAGSAIGTDQQKDTAGTRLINKFCKPRNPTGANPCRRMLPENSPIDADRLYRYCLQDVATETDIGRHLVPMTPTERGVWRVDQAINARGVAVDRLALSDCIAVVDQATDRYTRELQELTGGRASSVSKVAEIIGWLNDRGCCVSALDESAVTTALTGVIPDPAARRVLEIRQQLANSSVKKIYSMERRLTDRNRLTDMFAYCGADRTGRWAGRGPQPQNLPPSTNDIETVLSDMSSRSLDLIESKYGSALNAVSGCLRGLFIAGSGFELICSDYSSIEAIVLAELAGEQWRIDLFNSGGSLYERSGAMVTGINLNEIEQHRIKTGENHPARRIGKVAELASGYQGSVGAWKQFGATGSDDEILVNVRKWRASNPAIVDFWYAIERAAVAAIESPGRGFNHRGLIFESDAKTLRIRLLSGRCLCYQQPHTVPDVTPWGKPVKRLMYYGHKHVGGWQAIDTFGGRLVENICQGTARDILAGALVRLEHGGYPVVMHVHDEPVSEVPIGTGNLARFESLMCALPEWCRGWPITASGGWIGRRYRKG